MPHLIDFDSIDDKIFSILHLCGGSVVVCNQYKIGRRSGAFNPYEWGEYCVRLKSIVSNNLIEIAIKCRMFEDVIKYELNEDDILAPEGIDLKKKDKEARAGLNIGEFEKRRGTLTLRESFNKIVHATEAKLVWVGSEDAEAGVEWWDGTYALFGRRGSEAWNIELGVADWCLAVRKYLHALHSDIEWKYIDRRDE